jgi:Transposase DDE domain
VALEEHRLADLDNWPILVSFLPAGWQEEAKKTGALTRCRGVNGPEELLRILLIHLGKGYSLAETAVRAKLAGLGELTSVALFKRLRASEHWLRWFAIELGVARGWELPAENLRYRVVDATVVSEPGSTGTDWRLHYSLRLSDLRCDFFEITDVQGGETWRRVPVAPGDVLLGDRIYETPTGIAHVLGAKEDVIVRVNQHALPLFEAEGKPFPMFRRFAKLRVGHAQHWATFALHNDQRLHGRLIAVKRSAEATRRVRKRIVRKASRKQVNIPKDSWRAAPYFFLWTSLPDAFKPNQVLEAYRLRWQIELAFKRMKSILGFGHLPKKDPASARAWLHGKLLSAFSRNI